MQRILKGERPFELTELHTQRLIFLPLGKKIYHPRRLPQGGRIAVELYLCLPIEVAKDAPFKRETCHTDVETVAVCAVLPAILILR